MPLTTPTQDQLENSKPEVNVAYEYESEAMSKILEYRVQEQFGSTQPMVNSYKLEVMGAVDNLAETQYTLDKMLRDEQNASAAAPQARCLLIPCNLGGGHWVGMMLQINSSGIVERAEYIDPMGRIEPDAKLKAQLLTVYPHAQLTSKQILTQPDRTSCGAYTIENLIYSAVNKPLYEISPIENIAIREMHLATLRQYDPTYYANFYVNQRDNTISVPEITEQLRRRSKPSTQSLKKEQQDFNAITSCLNEFEDLEFKNKLIALFQSEQAPSEQDPKEYNDNIRNGLSEILATFTPDEQANNSREVFNELCKLLFKDFVDQKKFEDFKVDFNTMQDVGRRYDVGKSYVVPIHVTPQIIPTAQAIPVASASIPPVISTPQEITPPQPDDKSSDDDLYKQLTFENQQNNCDWFLDHIKDKTTTQHAKHALEDALNFVNTANLTKLLQDIHATHNTQNITDPAQQYAIKLLALTICQKLQNEAVTEFENDSDPQNKLDVLSDSIQKIKEIQKKLVAILPSETSIGMEQLKQEKLEKIEKKLVETNKKIEDLEKILGKSYETIDKIQEKITKTTQDIKDIKNKISDAEESLKNTRISEERQRGFHETLINLNAAKQTNESEIQALQKQLNQTIALEGAIQSLPEFYKKIESIEADPFLQLELKARDFAHFQNKENKKIGDILDKLSSKAFTLASETDDAMIKTTDIETQIFNPIFAISKQLQIGIEEKRLYINEIQTKIARIENIEKKEKEYTINCVYNESLYNNDVKPGVTAKEDPKKFQAIKPPAIIFDNSKKITCVVVKQGISNKKIPIENIENIDPEVVENLNKFFAQSKAQSFDQEIPPEFPMYLQPVNNLGHEQILKYINSQTTAGLTVSYLQCEGTVRQALHDYTIPNNTILFDSKGQVLCIMIESPDGLFYPDGDIKATFDAFISKVILQNLKRPSSSRTSKEKTLPKISITKANTVYNENAFSSLTAFFEDNNSKNLKYVESKCKLAHAIYNSKIIKYQKDQLELISKIQKEISILKYSIQEEMPRDPIAENIVYFTISNQKSKIVLNYKVLRNKTEVTTGNVELNAILNAKDFEEFQRNPEIFKSSEHFKRSLLNHAFNSNHIKLAFGQIPDNNEQTDSSKRILQQQEIDDFIKHKVIPQIEAPLAELASQKESLEAISKAPKLTYDSAQAKLALLKKLDVIKNSYVEQKDNFKLARNYELIKEFERTTLKDLKDSSVDSEKHNNYEDNINNLLQAIRSGQKDFGYHKGCAVFFTNTPGNIATAKTPAVVYTYDARKNKLESFYVIIKNSNGKNVRITPSQKVLIDFKSFIKQHAKDNISEDFLRDNHEFLKWIISQGQDLNSIKHYYTEGESITDIHNMQPGSIRKLVFKKPISSEQDTSQQYRHKDKFEIHKDLETKELQIINHLGGNRFYRPQDVLPKTKDMVTALGLIGIGHFGDVKAGFTPSGEQGVIKVVREGSTNTEVDRGRDHKSAVDEGPADNEREMNALKAGGELISYGEAESRLDLAHLTTEKRKLVHLKTDNIVDGSSPVPTPRIDEIEPSPIASPRIRPKTPRSGGRTTPRSVAGKSTKTLTLIRSMPGQSYTFNIPSALAGTSSTIPGVVPGLDLSRVKTGNPDSGALSSRRTPRGYSSTSGALHNRSMPTLPLASTIIKPLVSPKKPAHQRAHMKGKSLHMFMKLSGSKDLRDEAKKELEKISENLEKKNLVALKQSFHLMINRAAECCDILEQQQKTLGTHNDFKPANVTITRDGTCKTIDFGTVSKTGVEPETKELNPVKHGTPVFMRPGSLDDINTRLQAQPIKQADLLRIFKNIIIPRKLEEVTRNPDYKFILCESLPSQTLIKENPNNIYYVVASNSTNIAYTVLDCNGKIQTGSIKSDIGTQTQKKMEQDILQTALAAGHIRERNAFNKDGVTGFYIKRRLYDILSDPDIRMPDITEINVATMKMLMEIIVNAKGGSNVKKTAEEIPKANRSEKVKIDKKAQEIKEKSAAETPSFSTVHSSNDKSPFETAKIKWEIQDEINCLFTEISKQIMKKDKASDFKMGADKSYDMYALVSTISGSANQNAYLTTLITRYGKLNGGDLKLLASAATEDKEVSSKTCTIQDYEKEGQGLQLDKIFESIAQNYQATKKALDNATNKHYQDLGNLLDAETILREAQHVHSIANVKLQHATEKLDDELYTTEKLDDEPEKYEKIIQTLIVRQLEAAKQTKQDKQELIDAQQEYEVAETALKALQNAVATKEQNADGLPYLERAYKAAKTTLEDAKIALQTAEKELELASALRVEGQREHKKRLAQLQGFVQEATEENDQAVKKLDIIKLEYEPKIIELTVKTHQSVKTLDFAQQKYEEEIARLQQLGLTEDKIKQFVVLKDKWTLVRNEVLLQTELGKTYKPATFKAILNEIKGVLDIPISPEDTLDATALADQKTPEPDFADYDKSELLEPLEEFSYKILFDKPEGADSLSLLETILKGQNKDIWLELKELLKSQSGNEDEVLPEDKIKFITELCHYNHPNNFVTIILETFKDDPAKRAEALLNFYRLLTDLVYDPKNHHNNRKLASKILLTSIPFDYDYDNDLELIPNQITKYLTLEERHAIFLEKLTNAKNILQAQAMADRLKNIIQKINDIKLDPNQPDYSQLIHNQIALCNDIPHAISRIFV